MLNSYGLATRTGMRTGDGSGRATSARETGRAGEHGDSTLERAHLGRPTAARPNRRVNVGDLVRLTRFGGHPGGVHNGRAHDEAEAQEVHA